MERRWLRMAWPSAMGSRGALAEPCMLRPRARRSEHDPNASRLWLSDPGTVADHPDNVVAVDVRFEFEQLKRSLAA
jgi:hypothetical protein